MPARQRAVARAPQDRKPKAEKPEPVTFTVDGVTYDLPSEEDLDLGETLDIEQITGMRSFEEIPTAHGIAALVYIAMRRKRPDTTWDDVRSLPWRQLNIPKALLQKAAKGSGNGSGLGSIG